MISRTLMLRRTLPIIGHHAGALAAAAIPHRRLEVPPPSLFTPFVHTPVRRGWNDDDDATALLPARRFAINPPTTSASASTHSILPPLIRLRWEDVETSLPPPSPTSSEEPQNQVVEDAPTLPTATATATATAPQPQQQPPAVAALSSEEREMADIELWKSMLGEDAHWKSGADREFLCAKFPLPSKYHMRLAVPYVAPINHRLVPAPMAPRRKAVPKYIIHRPLDAEDRPAEELPEFVNIRDKLSTRSQCRLRLRSLADAVRLMNMLEKQQQFRLPLVAFLKELGEAKQRKMLGQLPELRKPLERFMKVAMR